MNRRWEISSPLSPPPTLKLQIKTPSTAHLIESLHHQNKEIRGKGILVSQTLYILKNL